MIKCFKCGVTTGRIVKHHIKYEPEEIVDCCWSCHQKIHNRVKKLGKCVLSKSKIKKITMNSSSKRYREASQQIYFQETLIPGIRLRETLCYNHTGGITWCAGFEATNSKDLYIVGNNENKEDTV